ncbi:MAG: RtcB family protein [Candidatus Omnitrophica bacterium]|jgi:tRNA-splicing ligase RtcB|nr:RtcB family protein [Candidatus Omnitrophota bacterium]
MKFINEEKALVIKSWCDNPEESAVDQARNLARLPFAFKQICLMPDTHMGYGMPIGGVLATEDIIIPNAIGLDIGCGMCSIKTSLTEIDKEVLRKIMGEIRKRIPVGFSHQQQKQSISNMPTRSDKNDLPIIDREFEKALTQIGTLGGGNHFIEIQKGSDGNIWIMLHSGSRNIGLQVAQHYNKIAIDMNAEYFSSVPKNWDLAFLPTCEALGSMYWSEMNYCVEFALANRKLMMDRICQIIGTETNAAFFPMINIAHNYARRENHFGKNVIVHRKGATSAREGEMGIIPGSQGTSSYIVKGRGNVESFQSCSHGAGRKMGRKEAQRTLNLEEEKKQMEDRGILHAIRGRDDLDEAPGSYKDIDVVMKEQEDLVEVIVKLEPLACIKG